MVSEAGAATGEWTLVYGSGQSRRSLKSAASFSPASPSRLGRQSDERVRGSPLGPSARTDKGKAPAVAPSRWPRALRMGLRWLALVRSLFFAGGGARLFLLALGPGAVRGGGPEKACFARLDRPIVEVGTTDGALLHKVNAGLLDLRQVEGSRAQAPALTERRKIKKTKRSAKGALPLRRAV
ncbi:unnamed protein product [Dovyalis caffra]|uniref:Uncharacterized protein n=1 Tax=Dovyalis caffra TaxID=77055 RepID=A0AAV1RHZ9_9ROSI|nr:unnamed protein product [Dovyalis caffra]